MTPEARLAAAIEILDAVLTDSRPADGICRDYMRARRYIGAKDRQAIHGHVYATLRARLRLARWLARQDRAETGRSLTLARLALIEGEDPERLAARFSGHGYAPAPLDGSERALIQALAGQPLEPPQIDAATRAECPAWAAPHLQARFGADFATEMAALKAEAPMDLRVNSLTAERDAARSALAATGATIAPTPISPLGLRVRERLPLGDTPLLREGKVEIQDESSQICGLLVDARPGQHVVDFCAGAGGKTLLLGATMAGKGRIFACDTLEGRLRRARQRLTRAGVHNVQTRIVTGARDKWVKRHKQRYHRVLIDAPCTGTGVWRRNPDMRWNNLGPDLDALTTLQAELLDSTARLVRPGGRLIYATCSLLPAENEDRIAAFLDSHPDFAPCDVTTLWPEIPAVAEAIAAGTAPAALPVPGPYLQLTPAQHGTDGFFCAVLERQS